MESKNKNKTEFIGIKKRLVCQREGVGGGQNGLSRSRVQISSYKINKSWGCNVQHDDYN